MRIFIALELPEDVRAKIFHSFEKLKGANVLRGKFVEKDNLHLTLKFLGELSEAQISEVEKKLGEIKFDEFECETGNFGAFPSNEHPKVLWVELLSDSLNKLQNKIEEALGEMVVEDNDSEKFSPHVTTVRLYALKSKKFFQKAFEEVRVKKMVFNIDAFSLIKSELTPQGPIYKVLKKFKLSEEI